MTVIAIVGRPNVGKSTLFNRFARKRAAIVTNQPGVTRDRNIIFVDYKGYAFTLIDTGGFEPGTKEILPKKMREQSQLAIEEADGIIFLLDREQGWNSQDAEIYEYLRKSNKCVYFTVNKVDSPKHELDLADFYASGVETIFSVSAEHALGVNHLLESISKDFPDLVQEKEKSNEAILSVAIVGRPNAGKSSLVNCFLGENRHLVDAVAGTTRDPIDSILTCFGRKIRLIDTAGMRKKSKVSQKIETYSVVASLKSIERADVVLLIMDVHERAVDQDAKICNYITERGKAVILIANKWDLVKKDSNTLKKVREEIRTKLHFMEYSPILFVSAKSGQRLAKILEKVLKVYENYAKRFATSDVNRVLETILVRHQPPLRGGRKVKIFYASQVSSKPPTFVLKTNAPEKIPDSYKLFMENQFRHYFKLEGTPLRFYWRKRDSHSGRGE